MRNIIFLNIRWVLILSCLPMILIAQNLEDAYKKAPKAPQPMKEDCCCTGGCFCHNELMPYLWDSTSVGLDYRKAYEIGQNKLKQLIQDYMAYPQIALDNKIEDVVYTRFIIEKSGEIDLSSIEVIRVTNPALEKEAIQIIKKISQHKWIPAQQISPCGNHDKNKIAVQSRIIIPIKFKLKK